MDITELLAWLTEGITPEQAAQVRPLLERDSVKSKVAGLRQQQEFDTIQTRATQLQAELDGGPQKPGAKAYQKWYEENFQKIQEINSLNQAYQQRYGTLEAPKTGVPTQPNAQYLTRDEVLALYNENFQSKSAPDIANVLKQTGTIVQKHMYAGRKTPIDFDALDKLMAERKLPTLEAAYDEWDKPERQAAEKTERESEIKRRVDEELQKRGASSNFPAGADLTPGALSRHTKEETEKFDKVALSRDMAKNWITGATQ